MQQSILFLENNTCRYRGEDRVWQIQGRIQTLADTRAETVSCRYRVWKIQGAEKSLADTVAETVEDTSIKLQICIHSIVPLS